MEAPQMVCKSNALVEAAYRLSVAEQRIMLACISQVRRDQPITDEMMYSVSAADVARMSGTAIEAAYSELKDAALRLKRREVRLTQEPNGKGKIPSVMITGWVQTIIYREGEGRVDLRFTKDMLPYLSELSEQFTRYALSDVAKMTSAHAIRLFEVLAQYGSVGQREVSVDQLRDWLQLEGRYPAIKDFKLRVIEPAVEQINHYSPLQVAWNQRKTGRTVTHLAFTFGPKKAPKAAKKGAKSIPKPKAGGALSDSELAALARPGETWEQVRARVNRDRSGSSQRVGPFSSPEVGTTFRKSAAENGGPRTAEHFLSGLAGERGMERHEKKEREE